MLIRAGTVDLDPPRRSTTVVPPVSFSPVSLPAATAPVPQRGTASIKSSPSQKFPSSSPAALLPDAARFRTASTAAKSVLLTNYAFMVDDALWAGTSRCRLNFGRLTRNIMVGTTSFECDRFVKYVHRHIERPSETLARVETKKLPPGVPAKFPGPNGLQFCFFPVLHLNAVSFCCCFGLPPLFGGRDSTPRQVWWTGSPSIPLCCDMFSGFC